MPVSYQIIPEHVYPHQMVQINDNTEVKTTYSAYSSPVTALLCVFASPRGRDNKVITIQDGAKGFVEEFGIGPYSLYGQPYLNAYAAAMSGACTLHCMRVTPENAAYSNVTLIAKYKIEEVEDPGTHVQTKTLKIGYYAKGSDEALTTLDDLDISCSVDSSLDEQGYTAVKLMSVASLGKGTYGKNLRFRITTDRSSDKNNDFKNYFFGVYDSTDGLYQKEQFSVVFNSEAMYSNVSLFADDVVNDSINGSTRVKVACFDAGFKTLYDAYMKVNPDCTLTCAEFDPFFGLDKNTRLALPGLEILADVDAPDDDAAAVAVSATDGVALLGGSDGSLAPEETAENREAALNTLYLAAFNGQIDPYIKSKNRFPTTLMLDANYPVNVKLAMANLALSKSRSDGMVMLDCGLGITTKASVKPYVDS